MLALGSRVEIVRYETGTPALLRQVSQGPKILEGQNLFDEIEAPERGARACCIDDMRTVSSSRRVLAKMQC